MLYLRLPGGEPAQAAYLCPGGMHTAYLYCNLLRGSLDGRPARWTELVHCVGFVRYTETTSGCVRSGRERFASVWLCSVNGRVDASGRERRTVCPCLLTDVFISTDTIHMTRKGNISHELSPCNWVTTGRKADAVCTRRSGHVPFASVVCSVNANPTRAVR